MDQRGAGRHGTTCARPHGGKKSSAKPSGSSMRCWFQISSRNRRAPIYWWSAPTSWAVGRDGRGPPPMPRLPSRINTTDHFRYHVLAGLLAITHNREAYEKLCQRLLPKFIDTTNPYIAERMALDCLLLPRSGVDLRLVDKLAGTAISVGAGNESLPYFQGVQGNVKLSAGPIFERSCMGGRWRPQAPCLTPKPRLTRSSPWRIGNSGTRRWRERCWTEGDALAPPCPQ